MFFCCIIRPNLFTLAFKCSRH